MLKKLSKIMILITLLLGVGASTLTPIALTANAETLLEEKFQVTKYLDLDGGAAQSGKKEEQAQSYFKEASPTMGFIVKVIEIAVKIAGTLAVLLMIGTGIAMVVSQGNQNVLEKAKQMFLYEILGLVMIFLSYVLVTFVQSIFTTG